MAPVTPGQDPTAFEENFDIDEDPMNDNELVRP